ncbi:sugar transferase [Domibacillus indicus]|nr:sugar transferase [Domibacillus indicus]
MIIALLPVFACTGLAVYKFLGNPVFYKQQRAGRNGIPFNVFKFRTMTDERDALGELLPDASRLGKLGIFLRRYSLDELPQLWNVLRGDMSLVGPRPLFVHYVPLYNAQQARRLEVKPGLTGWSQVNGRNAISWEEKFRLDVWYVEKCSLWLDLYILLLTVWRVLRPVGINQPEQATVEPFKGSDSDT